MYIFTRNQYFMISSIIWMIKTQLDTISKIGSIDSWLIKQIKFDGSLQYNNLKTKSVRGQQNYTTKTALSRTICIAISMTILSGQERALSSASTNAKGALALALTSRVVVVGTPRSWISTTRWRDQPSSSLVPSNPKRGISKAGRTLLFQRSILLFHVLVFRGCN